MTAGDRRLDRLYPALIALERAQLILRAVKEDGEVDSAVWMTVPAHQRAAYSRLVGLINALNCEVASVVFILHEQAGKVALRLAWLQTVHIWAMEVAALGGRALARTRSGRERAAVEALLARAPSLRDLPFDLATPVADEPATGEGYGDELARALTAGIVSGLQQHWCEVRSVDRVADEVRQEFNGEDPLHPQIRELLEGARATLAEARDAVAVYAGAVDLAEPDDGEVELVRRLIAKAIEKA